MGGGRGRGLTLRRVAAYAWLALATVLLWMPPPPKPRFDWPWLDEAVHFTLFVGLGALLRWAGHRARGVIAFGIVWAVVTEVGQGMLPWTRTPDWVDAAADIAGTLVGVGLAVVAGRATARRRPK